MKKGTMDFVMPGVGPFGEMIMSLCDEINALSPVRA